MRTVTECIWTISGKDLILRGGEVGLAEADLLDDNLDTSGALRITSGLQTSDLIVFLGFTKSVAAHQESLKTSTGYLVTAVEDDYGGTGMIVDGDLVESDPENWATKYLVEGWRSLDAENYSLRDFGLGFLAVYVESQWA
jgi:hypothetical protein